MKRTITIIIIDTEGNEHYAEIEIDNTLWGLDRTHSIGDAAVLWCSDNGYEYDTWEYV